MASKIDIEEKLSYLTSECYNDNHIRQKWAKYNMRLAAGDASVFPKLFAGIEEAQKKSLFINHIDIKCSTLVGELKNYQKSLIARSTHENYDKFSSQLTKYFYWCTNQTKRHSVMMQAFHQGVTKTGLALVRLQRTFAKDIICGDPYLTYYAPNTFKMDSKCKKLDLSDCRYIELENKYLKKDIKQMLGDNITFDDFLGKKSDYEFCNFRELYHADYREIDIIYNERTEAQQRVQERDKDRIDEILSLDSNLRVVKRTIPTVKLAIYVDDDLSYYGANELLIDRYPFVQLVGDWDPTLDMRFRYRGLVSKLADAQFVRSRIQTIQLVNLEDIINPMKIYPINWPMNIDDIYNYDKRKGIATQPNQDPGNLRFYTPPQLDASALAFGNNAIQEMDMVSGLNPVASGTDSGNVAGVTNRGREKFSFRNYTHYYTNFLESNINLGAIFADFARANYSPAKLFKILQEEPVPEFFNGATECYEIVISNGLDTDTQRDLQRFELAELQQVFNMPAPPEFILNTYDMQDKDKYLAFIQQQKEAEQQAKQAEQESELQSKEAERKVLEATAASQIGSALERSTKAAENRASIENEQVEQITKLAKALKDLEGIDIDNINKYFNMISTLQQLTPPPVEPVEEAIVAENIPAENTQPEGDPNNEIQGMQQQQVQEL